MKNVCMFLDMKAQNMHIFHLVPLHHNGKGAIECPYSLC